MLLPTLVSIAAVIGIPIGLVTLYFYAREGIRTSRKARDEQYAAPFKAQIDILTQAHESLLRSEQYYRNKVDQLEAELRRRN
jgi:hypothetical protein